MSGKKTDKELAGRDTVQRLKWDDADAKKRILYVVESFSTGIFSYLVDLCNNLADEYDIVIAYGLRPETPDNFKEYFDDRVRFVYVPHFARPIGLHDLKAVKEVKEIAKKVKPQVIHLHSSKAGAVGRIAFSGKEAALYYTPHGYSFLMKDQSLIKRFIYRSIEKICAVKGCTTISCSEGEHKESLKLTKKACYVNNGINVEEFRKLLAGIAEKHDGVEDVKYEGTEDRKHCGNGDRKHDSIENGQCDSMKDRKHDGIEYEMHDGIEGKKHDRFTVFTSGRIGYQKNPKLFNAIASALPDVHFLWIGSGDEEDELFAKNIEITGWVSRNQVLEYALSCDAFLLPSLWEGLPVSLLEAMYLKKPCVVSNVIGNRDVIHNGENGFVCDTTGDYVKSIMAIQDEYEGKGSGAGDESGSLEENAGEERGPGKERGKGKENGKGKESAGKVHRMAEKAYEDILNVYNTKTMAKEYKKIYEKGLSAGRL